MNPGQREFEVYLPIGYTDSADHVQRRAVLRKMSGHEEALLYDTSLNAGQLVTELLRRCLVRLGDMTEVSTDAVAQLYTADRNYLLLELRRITLGDRLQASYPCPRCHNDVAIVEDLGQIAVRRLNEGETLTPIDLDLDDGYFDRQGQHHTHLTMTLPRGKDEEFVSPMATRDPLKAQDALLLRCIERFGTLPQAALEAYGVKILRDLTLADRYKLQQTFHEQMPGVDFRRDVQCPNCHTTFNGVMDVSNFFVVS